MSKKISKRQKLINEKISFGKQYPIEEALTLLQGLPSLKFIESIEISVNLGVDPKKSDQMVRSSVVLPHGTGRKVRVAVFANGEQAQKALDAGADVVGFEDLSEQIKQGNIDFDLLIATPDAMRLVGQLGQILGPKGLMPNPKVGTVTADVANAVKNAKAGQVQYRMDKGGVVHCAVGKLNFGIQALKENIETFLTDLKRVKPTTSKGIYLKKVAISSTMGPGLAIDLTTLTM
ncbi:MAG: 50S ribosomal protein L1 [Gammaproteobacteria bacterium GWE2_37_16]|nr:MAG: 50S ribosomal protein L1 [Gammaproteobacteria bacterium GWE2_37_16]